MSDDTVSRIDFQRLESKVDDMMEKLSKVIIFEERQTNQSKDIAELKQENALLKAALISLEKKVDQWINRGMGVWAVAGIMWAVFEMASNSGIFRIVTH
jgi:hypothetical protein